MANRNQLYRRQTKAYQRNMYHYLYGRENVTKRKVNKYLSIAGIIAPAIVVIVSFIIKKYTLFFFALAVWVICIVAVFINMGRKQSEFVRNLKESGMPKKEYIKQMKGRTKSQAQLERYIKLWDQTEVKKNSQKKVIRRVKK